jgi:hypothetical protein
MPTDSTPVSQRHVLPAIPLPLLVSLATGPVLCALFAGKAVSQTLIEVGLNSEEIFRGDRLPILPFVQSGDVSLGDEPC